MFMSHYYFFSSFQVVDMYSDLNAPKGHLGTFKTARCDTGFVISSASSKDTIMELSLNKGNNPLISSSLNGLFIIMPP